MRLSDFWTLMRDEFGDGYASTVARDHVMSVLGERTVDEAIVAGIAPRAIWEAVCDSMDIPPERRLGIDRPLRPTRD